MDQVSQPHAGDCLAALTVDDYVAGGPGELDEIMTAGFSHDLGAAPSNRELVSWMRRWNAERDPVDRLRFLGIDAPTELTRTPPPRATLLTAHDYLASHLDDPDLLPADATTIDRLLGEDDRWTSFEAMTNAHDSIGRTAEAVELRLLAEEMLGLLDSESPHLVAATSATAWNRARLHARSAAWLLRYHATMAEDSPRRMSRLSGQRDAMMAANLITLGEEELDRGPTLLFAHNSHLQRWPSTMQLEWEPFTEAMRWWSAGSIVATRLGERYVWVAMTVGRGPERGLEAPAADTLEGELDAITEGPVLVDARRLGTALQAAGRKLAPRTDTTTDQGYVGFDPDHLGDVDGIIHVERIGPMIPQPAFHR
ncbi:erythromycin esterase family protein [Pseudonocardia nematodicida]|uniref:Erythromycin esterase family protein n=1 Tax=Pseudonocardia nematodicida TaxID=1206997 RepID=A0ABV1K5E3_9PSEU